VARGATTDAVLFGVIQEKFELLQHHIVGVGQLVAVGTAIADRPPHRSVRAELPHTAPA